MEITESFYNDMIRIDQDTCFEIDDPDFMKGLMIIFFESKAAGLSDDELLTAFGDQKQILDDWISFLKSRLERCKATIH